MVQQLMKEWHKYFAFQVDDHDVVIYTTNIAKHLPARHPDLLKEFKVSSISYYKTHRNIFCQSSYINFFLNRDIDLSY